MTMIWLQRSAKLLVTHKMRKRFSQSIVWTCAVSEYLSESKVTSAAKQQSACQKLKKPEKQAGVIKDKPAGKGKKASKATTAAAPSAAVEPEIPAPAPAAGGWRQTVICLDLLALVPLYWKPSKLQR